MWNKLKCSCCNSESQLSINGQLRYCQECVASFERKLSELRTMAPLQNEGHGLSCVRMFINYIEYGNLVYAARTADNNHDKIKDYQEIKILIGSLLWPKGNVPKMWRR